MVERTQIRVLLVDDHAMVRRGLEAFLSDFKDLVIVGEASDGEAAIEICGRLQPDVVLMDLLLPGMDGATATYEIRRRFPHIQVIALTGFRDEALLLRTLQAGAIGYLFKDIAASELVATIRAAHAGQATLAAEATNALLQTIAQPAASSVVLTHREREVLTLMASGLSNTLIARRLIVSTSTIKWHVSNILAKLGVVSRSEAVALAVRQHLIPAESATPATWRGRKPAG